MNARGLAIDAVALSFEVIEMRSQDGENYEPDRLMPSFVETFAGLVFAPGRRSLLAVGERYVPSGVWVAISED